MGMPEKALAYIEAEDYLVLENASRYKHEYMGGVIYAIQGDPTQGMAGGSAARADLIRNVGFALHTRLKGSLCSVKMTEMRLRVEAADAFFYPDVMVHCGAVDDPVGTMELTRARLVVEVLSPITQSLNGGQKLAAYRQLPGLQHIILISSLEEAAWACHRINPTDAWSTMASWPKDTALELAGLGLSLPWDEVYGGVGLR
jgi:Uma2 family endonuclease